MKKQHEEGAAGMPEHEKEKEKDKIAPATIPAAQAAPPEQPAPAAKLPVAEEDPSQYFFGEPLVGFDPSEITGTLIVIEGMDGSGRSTPIALLQEWLQTAGLAVQ